MVRCTLSNNLALLVLGAMKLDENVNVISIGNADVDWLILTISRPIAT